MAIHSLTVTPCYADALGLGLLPGRDAKWGILVHKPREAGRRADDVAGWVVSPFGPETRRLTVPMTAGDSKR